MKNTMRNEIGLPAVLDRNIFQAELDSLWVREKAHTRDNSNALLDVTSTGGRSGGRTRRAAGRNSGKKTSIGPDGRPVRPTYRKKPE